MGDWKFGDILRYDDRTTVMVIARNDGEGEWMSADYQISVGNWSCIGMPTNLGGAFPAKVVWLPSKSWNWVKVPKP